MTTPDGDLPRIIKKHLVLSVEKYKALVADLVEWGKAVMAKGREQGRWEERTR